MKTILLNLIVLLSFTAVGQNMMDQYLTNPLTYITVGNSSNQINQPRDLDFKPNSNELWIANRGGSSGGAVVIIHDAGLPTQSSEYRKDTHSSHFMIYPTAISFGDIGEWASVQEIQNTSGSGTSTFMGPSLWSSDLNIFATVFQNNWVSGFPLGSHLDMLHQSPFSMGIAHDNNRQYWVFDGWNGNICKYDYVMGHGPGYENHSAGKIWRYTDVSVTREPNVPSHMVVDKTNNWLYFVDTGNKKLKRLKTTSGTNSGNLTASNETLSGYYNITGALVEVVDSFPGTMPCGIDIYSGRLLVGNNTNGNIFMYDITGTNPVFLDTIITGQSGMMGIKVGQDGKIWFVNNSANEVVRIDAGSVANDAAVLDITTPAHIDYEKTFYSTQFNICSASSVLNFTLKNTGSNSLTSATINYSIDGASPSSISWSGSLAPGSTATVALPSITFSSGSHKVKIYSSSPNGNADSNPANDASEGAFRVLASPASIPFSEYFSTSTFPPTGWSYINFNPNNKMSRSSSVGGFGNTPSGALKMDNFSAPSTGALDITGQEDYFMSPRIDFSSATSGTVLDFSVAYAAYSGSADQLEVLISTDCGANWVQKYLKSGSTLSTAPDQTSTFTPTATQWRKEVINLDSYIGQSEIIVMFKTISNYGNNVYIDDINVHNTTGIANDEKNDPQVRVFPNPSNGKLVASANSKINSVSIFNLLGEKIFERNGVASESFSIDLFEKAAGLFFIRIECEGKIVTRKIVIE